MDELLAMFTDELRAEELLVHLVRGHAAKVVGRAEFNTELAECLSQLHQNAHLKAEIEALMREEESNG